MMNRICTKKTSLLNLYSILSFQQCLSFCFNSRASCCYRPVFCTDFNWLSQHCTLYLYCTTVHSKTLHCMELQYTALHCSALHCTALHWLQRNAMLDTPSKIFVHCSKTNPNATYQGLQTPTSTLFLKQMLGMLRLNKHCSMLKGPIFCLQWFFEVGFN